MTDVSCARCGTALRVEQMICHACGVAIIGQPATAAPSFSSVSNAGMASLSGLMAQETNAHRRKIRSGRGAILAVAILTLLGGILMYFLGQSETEKEIAKVEYSRCQ